MVKPTRREKKSIVQFRSGIVLGLVVGIVGNIVAQYFSLVLERAMLRMFDAMFVIDLVVLAISITVVISIVLYFRKKASKEVKEMLGMMDSESNLINHARRMRIEIEASKLDLNRREESEQSETKGKSEVG